MVKAKSPKSDIAESSSGAEIESVDDFKPTHTDSYNHYSTSAPQFTKDSLIRSLTRRAYDICSPQHLQHELDHIRTVLLDNVYPLSRITDVMYRTKQSIDLPASAR